MPKVKISEFSSTPANNTDIDSINIAEGCAPSGINDAIRELMAQLKDFQTGAVGDSFNGPIGTSTAAAGAFTTLAASSTLGVTGVATFSAGTAALPALTTTGDTNTGIFFPAADTVATSVAGTEGMRLTSTGLGIGTTSPATKLHVNNTTGGVQVRASSDSDVSFSAVATAADSTAFFTMLNDARQWTMRVNGAESDQFQLRDSTAGATRLVVNSSGDVGIGRSSPSAPLNVQGEATGGLAIRLNGRSSDNYSELAFWNNANSTNYGILGVDQAAMYFGTNTSLPVTFTTNSAERARIDSSGNLLVGTTATILSGKQTISYNGAVNGLIISESANTASTTFLAFVNGTSAIGAVERVGSTSAVVYGTTSDYRLKTVTGAVTGQGSRIDALKPVDYLWTDGGQQARGFLAHEFQAVYPNSVSGTKDAVDADGNPKYQAMQASNSEVIADLVAEIQSLRQRLSAANL